MPGFFLAVVPKSEISGTGSIVMLGWMLEITSSTFWPSLANPSLSTMGLSRVGLNTRCPIVVMCCVRSSVKTDCTTASGILGGDTSTSDCEVYLAGKPYETRNPASGASSAGIRITFIRRRNIAR